MTTTTPVAQSATTQRDWVALEQKYYQHTFKRSLVLERGSGVRVWDASGREYIDFVAGISTNVLGHAHPAVVRAIQEQATQLIHVSNLFINQRQVELAELLYDVSGGMRSFFSNSGAEANEGAIKLARKYGRTNRGGAYEIISFDRSFHGRTLATSAATGQKKYQDTWLPIPDGFKQVPFNDLEAVKAATSPKTAGILVEAVQGEGGINLATAEFMQGLRDWCDEQNLILIVDEVQAGVGPHWQVLRLAALRHPARHHDDGEGAGRRRADRRHARHAARGHLRAGRAWHHLRRQSAGLRRWHRHRPHDPG